jgi:hypothetical protein
MRDLLDALDSVLDICDVYVCSGNDLTFIERYVPAPVRDRFKGYILETGCVLSDGFEEVVLVPGEVLDDIKRLESALKAERIPEVKYFARRLATVSAFTRDEREGTGPEIIFDRIKEMVRELGYSNSVYVTHSNVAVDIIPVGFDKYTALEHVAKGRRTIGIADSLNDSHLILNADHGFVPKNASSALMELTGHEGRSPVPLADTATSSEISIRSSEKQSTECVIEVLRFIDAKLRAH